MSLVLDDANGNPRDLVGNLRLTYTPRSDATMEVELEALAAVYRFVLERREGKKKVAVQSDQEDAKGAKEHVRAKVSIPE